MKRVRSIQEVAIWLGFLALFHALSLWWIVRLTLTGFFGYSESAARTVLSGGVGLVGIVAGAFLLAGAMLWAARSDFYDT